MNAVATSSARPLTHIAALFVLVVVVTGVGLWRVSSSLDADKARILALAEELATCLYSGDVPCLRAISSWDDETLQRELARATRTQAALGTRGQAAPIEHSWSMRKFHSLSSGLTIMTRVSLTAPYERDNRAWERWEVVEHNGELRVRSVRVNSDKLPAP
jgi:hypothetical protein